MGIHKGTKLTDNPKDIVLKVRLDKETDLKLQTVCKETSRTKAQVIRDAINQEYARI